MLMLPASTPYHARTWHYRRAIEEPRQNVPGTGSTVYQPTGGYQVVLGPDYAKNSRRDKNAEPVAALSIGDAERKHRALVAWEKRNRQRLAAVSLPPVIHLGAPVADKPLRQLTMFGDFA